MNTKLLRNTAVRIRRFLLEAGLPKQTAWQGFIWTAAEIYLELKKYPDKPEHLVPELYLPEEIKPFYSEIRELLRPQMSEHDSVQVIGWLHQYYHNEEKDRIFADKNHKQMTEAEIPAATQFFTPEWLADYMIQNSLGRLFPRNWEYQLDTYPEENLPESPELIRLLDPCAGTGHILLSAFDNFMKIYLSRGESPETAVRKILEKNLFGLELDISACRIAEFSLLVKALEYDSDFLKTGIRPNLQYFPETEPEGSLLKASAVPETDRLLKQKYQIVITNPPYMGNAGMPDRLSAFVKAEYPDSWRDLCACFIERCSELTEENGFCALLTMQNWLFLPSFAGLRNKILHSHVITSLLHLGMCAFDTADVGTIVQSACWIMQKKIPDKQTGIYYHLCDYADAELKRQAFLHHQAKRYEIAQEQFFRIPDSPVIYWAPEAVLQLFQLPKLETFAEPKQGLTTSDNPRFVRLWHEVNYQDICFHAENHQQAEKSHKKWFPYHKGGGYRKWYGNHSHILNYENGGKELLAFHEELNKQHSGGRLKNKNYYFKPSVTWTFIARTPSFRKNPAGFLFDVAGSCLFADSEQEENRILAFLCSKPAEYLLHLLNPTMNMQARDLRNLPYLQADSDRIQELVNENIQLCREDWDSFETSWNFESHPLL